MPWTNFPFGISLTTATGTVAGQLNASNITLTSSTNAAVGTITVGTVSASGAIIAGSGSFTGTVTVGSGSQLIGGYTIIPVAFGTSSALQQISSCVPGFPNCSIDTVYLTFSSVSALVANYTVQVGSAGSVAVATVANTTASVGVAQALTTTAQTFDGTTSSVVCIRSVQGTVGDSVLTLVIRRTA
jgi:hypothetical protein